MLLPVSVGNWMVCLNKKQSIRFALLLCCCLFFLRVIAQPPAITSFSPVSGPVGSSVTISGSNFSPTASANTVYFGAVKASVTSASTTSLIVTVPAGATYQPITVTTANLTTSANGSFAVTFPSNPVGITSNSFAPKTDFVSGNSSVIVVATDLDDDGKVDMVTANQNAATFSVFRNTGSSGTISFATKIDYATGGEMQHVATGDIDGDGKPDLAVTTNATTVSIYKNTSTTGTISFAAKVDFATTRSGANCTAIGDLDGDGKPDLVVSSSSGFSSSVFKNTSTGGTISFDAAIDVFTFYRRVAICDFDGDGKPDLVGNAGNANISIFQNTTSGGSISFGPRLDFATTNATTNISTGDLDGDGKPEIAVASPASLVYVFRNTCATGTISFAAYVNFTTGNNARGLDIGDIDGDGKPDLAATASGAATVSVLKNNSVNGTLAFAAKVDYATGMYPYSVAIADMDGDGKPDLSVANYNNTASTISVLKNQTDGPNVASFTPKNAAPGNTIVIIGTFFTGATSVSIGGVAATSFTVDSDGQITAVIPGITGGSITVTTPNGSASLGGFYNGPVITAVSPVTGPSGTSVTISGTNFSPVAANNIVYAGAVKAPVSAASSSSLTVTMPVGLTYQPVTVTTGNRTTYSTQAFATTFTSNATGLTSNSFAARTDYSVSIGTNYTLVADIDGDGKGEIVSYNYTYNSISVLKNAGTTGNTAFVSGATLTLPNVSGIAAGDVDGDGKTDIFGTSYSGGLVSVFKNTSTGGNISFAAKVDVATVNNGGYIVIGDIDGDGKPDLGVAQSGYSIISLFRNISTGGGILFSAKTDVSINSVAKFSLGDLDGDGKPEIVVPNYYAATVSVLKNTSIPGVLSFASQVDYAVGQQAADAIISDINGDGKPDVAVANSGSASVSVLRNTSTTGTPSLAAAVPFSTSYTPMNISVADIDGDGRPDLAIANNGDYSVSILKNTGTAGSISFAPKVDLVPGTNVSYVSTGDLDGDGRPDLAVTSTDQGVLSVLRNQTAGTDIFSFSPTNATVGTSVVINGINFTGATAVSFGGVAAGSFTVNSDAQITATVAAVAGGKVSVTTLKGIATLNGFYNGPVVTSFSPVSGPVGTTVTINGSNFSATPANNTVYFGPVKAIVSAATASALTVTVPVGATFQPITVTAGNSTGYSNKPFAVTFPSVGSGFNANSLAPKIDFAAGTNPACVATGDFDGDGKPDMVVSNSGTSYLSIYKNTSSPGAISFGTRLDMGNGYYPTSIATGDINGDGKLDIVVIFFNSTSVYVYRNTSSGGTISFASEVAVYTGIGTAPRSVVVADLDGDGKPDLAVANSGPPSTAIIFRNNSTVATISFNQKLEITAAGGASYSLAAGDFDGDGKPDLALTNYTFGNFVIILSVFRNLSTPGTILFGDKKDYATGSNNKSVSVGDLDGDGKLDIAVTNGNENTVSLLRNTSSSGAISFATKLDIATGTTPYCVSIGDLDGDEKQDLVIANSGAASISFIKNQSTPGTLSFAAKQDFAVGNTPYWVNITDLDGDGKPDVAVANYNANTFSVLRNQVNAPFISSFTPANAGVGATVTINGSAFTGTTSVLIGGIAASSFTIVSDVQITATVAAIAGGDISVTTPNGTANSSGFYNGPVISSFSPTSGPVSTMVTITGSNFGSTPAANTVYFGAVKAAVSAANATSLTVNIPVGTTYQPPTVTTGSLTAFAGKPFTVTFPANTSSFTGGSFAPKTDFATGTNPYSIAVSDFDGDGKSDVAVVNSGSGNFSILKNTGTSGMASFAAKVDLASGTGPVNLTVSDFDGDGRTDVALVNFSAGTFSVFKNLSSTGAVSFAAKQDYTTAPNPSKLKVADVNADGKPDIIVVNSTNSGSVVSVYKNTSVGGNISFASKADFLNEQYFSGVAIGDFDSDGKPDIAVSYSNDYRFSILRNVSSNGIISFAPKVDITTTGTSYSLDVADLNGDGKDDIAITNYTLNLISFFRNTTTGSTVSFAPKVDVATAAYPQGIAIGDLDGDGKSDVAIANYSFGTNTLSVLKNSSSSGAIAFAAKTDYATGTSPVSLSIGDADGDGKPDLIAANYGSNSISILRNLLSLPEPCAGGSTTYASNITGASYQWQVNTGSGFTNISDGTNYTGTTTTTLQISSLPSAWYGYQYRCVVDGMNSNVFTLTFKNYWTGAISTAWENAGNWSCGAVPDGNTDVVINSGIITVQSAAICRSLITNPGVNLRIQTGYSIIVTH